MATDEGTPEWTDTKADERNNDEDEDGVDDGNSGKGISSPKRRKKEKANKRPLSAYNLFFKEERTRILREIEEDRTRPDYIANAEAAIKRVKNGSKSAAKFQAIASTIASRWKALTAQEREPYEELAAQEMERYKERKDEFHRNLVRDCEIAGRAAVSKNASSMEHNDKKPRPTLREDPSVLGAAGFFRSETTLPSSRTPLPSMMHLGPMTSMPLHTDPFIRPSLNQAQLSNPNDPLMLPYRGALTEPSLHTLPFGRDPDPDQAPPNLPNDPLPLALMMRQVEVEREIVRLQEILGQLQRQRELVLSPGAPRSFSQDWARSQVDDITMQFHQAQAMRDFPRRASTSAFPVARSQQESIESSALSMPEILALAQSLQQGRSNEGDQANTNANWRSFFG